MNKKVKSPFELNYIMPAEWEKHEATWLGWPTNKNDWPGKFSPIQWVYADIVKKIAYGEIVRIIVQSKEQEKKVNNILLKSDVNISNVEFYIMETDRGWLRDSGPTFVKNNKNDVAAVKFNFNAWAKYDNWKKDVKIPEMIVKKRKLNSFTPIYNNKIVTLEGGSIDVNGEGTLITTEECLMDEKVQVRNPGFTKEDYANVFNNYLGITNVLWLNKGIAGDDTHGHVDDLCRFVNKDTVVIVNEENPNDENYKPLQENIERLQDMELENGKKINYVKLPMPAPLIFDGMRLPASYANFYITNYAVLVPTFNDEKDKEALNILSELFTDRKVIGINSVDLVWGLGTLHCLTKEQVK